MRKISTCGTFLWPQSLKVTKVDSGIALISKGDKIFKKKETHIHTHGKYKFG